MQKPSTQDNLQEPAEVKTEPIDAPPPQEPPAPPVTPTTITVEQPLVEPVQPKSNRFSIFILLFIFIIIILLVALVVYSVFFSGKEDQESTQNNETTEDIYNVAQERIEQYIKSDEKYEELEGKNLTYVSKQSDEGTLKCTDCDGFTYTFEDKDGNSNEIIAEFIMIDNKTDIEITSLFIFFEDNDKEYYDMLTDSFYEIGESGELPEPTSVTQDTKTVKVYLKNTKTDPEVATCLADDFVTVELTDTDTFFADVVLLSIMYDPTDEEEDLGLKNYYLDTLYLDKLQNFKLISIDVENGTATLTLDDPDGLTSGGSCRVGILYTQLEKTLLQFEEIEKVVIKDKEGSTDLLFQP